MKIKILICLILFSTLSCKNTDESITVKKLSAQIDKLEATNKTLRDSLSNYEEEFLYSQILLGISDDCVLTVGKKNRVAMMFHTYKRELPVYDIYKIERGKEIKIGSNNNTDFNYDFTPKSIEDNELHLKVKLKYKNKVIEIPANVNFYVKK